jgi:hypothetical protein
VKETKTIPLSGNESRIVEFRVTENNEGSYSVKIGELHGVFIIADVPFPAALEIYQVTLTPFEAWANETVKISCKARNWGDEALTYRLAYRLDDVVIETKAIQLSAGEIIDVDPAFCSASSEGTHFVVVGGKTEPLYIVPTGKHTLRVALGRTDWHFYLNGERTDADYEELLDVGTYTVEVPFQWITAKSGGGLEFRQWADGELSRTRTIDLQGWTGLEPLYEVIFGVISCPSLSVWNGSNYVYITEVSAGTGYLPYFVYFGENGTRVFGYSDPWDYIRLEGDQLQPKDGYYDMKLTQRWDEIFYIDSVRLLAVDHSPDMDVYSTYGTRKYNLDEQGTIYTVSKNPSPPISAVYEGEDILAQISELEGIYATMPSEWEYQYQMNTLELDLGDLSGAEEIKLIVAGIVIWPPSEATAEWVAKFVTQPGVPPFPVQYMEVKDANGSWVRVPDNRQFPMLRTSPDTFVVNLTGLFPANDYSLRINTFFDWRFDYIGVDTTPQQEDVTIREIHPVYADLTQIFETYSTSTRNFTRYGDVTPLLLKADDKFVIGRQGDQVSLKFLSTEIGPVPEGMERDYFVVVSCWFKVPGLPYLDFAVDPLPFHDMSAFPYSPTESYPYDEDHLKYLREYNTREIAPAP